MKGSQIYQTGLFHQIFKRHENYDSFTLISESLFLRNSNFKKKSDLSKKCYKPYTNEKNAYIPKFNLTFLAK
jgi:hypothetical protein